MSSGGRTVHRLSRHGNRTPNHAIHIAAVNTSATSIASVALTTTRESAGKIKREATRALKRRISDRVYKQLVVDALQCMMSSLSAACAVHR